MKLRPHIRRALRLMSAKSLRIAFDDWSEPKVKPWAEAVRRIMVMELKREVLRRLRRGFTLLELLVAIAVIGILASMTAPAVTRAYRHCTAKAAWATHCRQARMHEALSPGPQTTVRFTDMSVDSAFRKFYPQYHSYADVPRSTVKYWRKEAEPTPAEDGK